MRLYSSHYPPAGASGRLPLLVRDGFSWLGLLLGWLALLRPGSWLCAALAGLATILIGLAARHLPQAWVLLPGLHLTVALFAADWRRWELRQAGFVSGPIVVGGDRTQALLRLLDERPEPIGRPA